MLRQKCEEAELKFKQDMDHIEFAFEYHEFLKLYSGDSGELGINFWKALLEANNNDFVEYEKIFSTFSNLAFQVTIGFMHYNLAAHKARVRENFIASQQDKLFRENLGEVTKDSYDDEYFLQNYKYLAESIDCENC